MRIEESMQLNCAASSPLFTAVAGTISDPPVPVAQPAVPVTPEQAKMDFVAHKRKRQPKSLESHSPAKDSSSVCKHNPSRGKERKLPDLAALQCPRISIRGISASGPSKLVHIQPRRQSGTENEAGHSARLPQREEKMSELHKRKWEVMERGGLTVAPMQQPVCQ